jgi:steroid delta-isomerase-like uncharacterized protein
MKRLLFSLVVVLALLLAVTSAAQEAADDLDANRALVVNFIEQVFNEGDSAAAGDYVTEAYLQNTPGVESGIAALQASVDMFHAAFPDIQYTVTHLGAEGDLVAARLVITGTQDGEFMGIPASGRRVSAAAINFWRVEDGLLAEHWEVVDTLTFLQQLGVIPGGQEAPEPSAEATEAPAFEVTETAPTADLAAENRAVVEQLYADVLNARDPEAAAGLIAQNFVWNNPFVAPGLEGYQGFYAVIFEAFPDVQREVGVSVADGDLVFVYNTITGTHLGGEQLYGIPPTGNAIRYDSAELFRLEEGLIVEQWDVADIVTLFGQIGLIPAPQG